MYHQTLPVPREIETVILKLSDAKGIFSYLATHTDAYQRALDPNFWWNFDYYLFQGIFLEAAKHKSYEMLESMLKGRRVDTYYYDKVRSEFIAENDYIGMSIFGSVYDRLSADKLKQAFQKRDQKTIEDLRGYLDAALGSSKNTTQRLPDVPVSEIFWLYSGNSGSIFENDIQEAVANSLLRLKRYRDFDEILNYRWDVLQDIVNARYSGQQEYEGIPLFRSIAGYADYDYYQQLEERDPYGVALEKGSASLEIIIDPLIYQDIYKRRRENYLRDYSTYGRPELTDIYRARTSQDKERYYQLLEVGFALKPDQWIALFTDVDPEDQEGILRTLINNAYKFGFENFGDTIAAEYDIY